MTYWIHQEGIGIEVGDSAFFHLEEFVVDSKLACLQQAFHRSNLLVNRSLKLAPRLDVSLIRQAG